MNSHPPIDRDIYAAALQLINLHGAEAAGWRAAERADELDAAGDMGGAATWRRILKAIGELSAGPDAGDVRH